MAAYPRKQTVVIFILCVFVVGGAGYYVLGQSNKPTTRVSPDSVAAMDTDVGPAANIPDTDWQKQFLAKGSAGTAFKPGAGAAQNTAPAEDLAPTDLLGRSFFGKYIDLRQRGLSEDPVAVSDAISESIAEVVSGVQSPKAYAASEILLVSDSAATLSSYSNTIADLIRDYSGKDDEALIALDAFESQDMSLLSLIDPVIQVYQGMISRLVSAPTPQSLSAQHLALVNSLSLAMYSAQSFRTIDTNPLQGLVGIRMSIEAEQGIATAIAAIQNSLATTSKQSSS